MLLPNGSSLVQSRPRYCALTSRPKVRRGICGRVARARFRARWLAASSRRDRGTTAARTFGRSQKACCSPEATIGTNCDDTARTDTSPSPRATQNATSRRARLEREQPTSAPSVFEQAARRSRHTKVAEVQSRAAVVRIESFHLSFADHEVSPTGKPAADTCSPSRQAAPNRG